MLHKTISNMGKAVKNRHNSEVRPAASSRCFCLCTLSGDKLIQVLVLWQMCLESDRIVMWGLNRRKTWHINIKTSRTNCSTDVFFVFFFPWSRIVLIIQRLDPHLHWQPSPYLCLSLCSRPTATTIPPNKNSVIVTTLWGVCGCSDRQVQLSHRISLET